jgi:hypothetical protein
MIAASPFTAAFTARSEELAPVFREQFLSPEVVTLAGTMERVWHKPVLSPMFWILGHFGILIPEAGTDIPAVLTILPGQTRTGLPIQKWNRTLQFSRPRRFDSIMVPDPKTGGVIEKVGPGKALHMAWDIRFEPDGSMVWQTHGWRLLGLPLPGRLGVALFGHVHFTQHALDATATRIAMRISHPLIGAIFEYGGVLYVRREGTP